MSGNGGAGQAPSVIGRNVFDFVAPEDRSKAVLRGTDGAPYGIVYLCRDITERKRADADLREGLTKLRSTLKASIDSLASAIEMRDPYTAGHQERVTRLGRAIACEMGLAEERVEAIEIAGIIHALGVASALEEIAQKRGILFDREVVDACLRLFREKNFKFE